MIIKYKLYENIVGDISINNIRKYLDRMSYGLWDKLFFIGKIKFDCIVDFGAADGVLLETIKKINPDICTIAYEIDSTLLSILKTKKIDYVFDNFNDIKEITKNYNSPLLLLSSVIHEIYSYSTKQQIYHFWKTIFKNNFKYIVIRDMLYKDYFDNFNIDNNDINKIYKKSNFTLKSFENIWGPINKNYHNLIHYLLKYKYIENWNRESKENYLPISLNKIKNIIPSNWNIIYEKEFILEYLRNIIKQDFDILLKHPTHIKLIIENNTYKNNHMKYIKKLNIDFDQWGKLNNNPGWHNIKFIEGKTIDYYKKMYPEGTKIRIRKDSIYYNRNTKNNPKDTIGYIYDYNDRYYIVKKNNHVVFVKWNTGVRNTYKIIDLEYIKNKKYEIYK